MQQPNTEQVTEADLLGNPRQEFVVRRGTATSYEVAQGELVQVIDLEGKQCSDFMAMNARSLDKGKKLIE